MLIAAVLGLVAWQYFVSIQEAHDFNEVSPALGIPRAWMYAFISATTALAAVLSLLAPAPQAADHAQEVAS